MQSGRGPRQVGCQVQAFLAENIVPDAEDIPQDEQIRRVDHFLLSQHFQLFFAGFSEGRVFGRSREWESGRILQS